MLNKLSFAQRLLLALLTTFGFTVAVATVLLIDGYDNYPLLAGLVLVQGALTFLLWLLLRQAITRPSQRLWNETNRLAKGQTDLYLTPLLNDADLEEPSRSLLQVADNLHNSTLFIQEIGEGNFNAEFKVSFEGADSDGDHIGKSLLSMRDKLRELSEGDKTNRWVTEGLALFVDILRSNDKSFSELADDIVVNLVKRLKANQGALFILNDSNEDDLFLDMTAVYAYNRKKFLNKRVELGQGLAGQCFLEGMTTYLKEVPGNYINITSGLGEELPKSVLIVPLKVNDHVMGVVEIASFNEFATYEIEFVEKLGESIAATVESGKIKEKTESLLEETRIQANELRSQEEEMRQNMEELEATQEELSRSNMSMQGLHKAVNESIIYAEYDVTGQILNANENYAKLGGHTINQLRGRPWDEFQVECQRDKMEVIMKHVITGKSFKGEVERETENGKKWLLATYTPALDEMEQVKKIYFLGQDVTRTKKLELEAKKQAKQLEENEEEMSMMIDEMKAANTEMEKKTDMLWTRESIFRGLIDSSDDMIVSVDPDYNVTNFNQRFVDLVAHRLEGEAMRRGLALSSLYPAKDWEGIQARLDRALRGERFLITEEVTLEGSTESINLQQLYNPVKDENDKTLGAVMIGRDITSDSQKLRELQQKIAAKEEYVATVQAKLKQAEKELTEAKDLN